MRKRDRNIAIGTVVAAGLGYAVGILTAPKSGKETRKDIQKTAVKAKTEAEKRLKDLHSELVELMAEGKKRAQAAKASAKTELLDALSKAQLAKEKAREVLSAVHEGDADDKDLKKAIDEVNSAVEHLKKYVGKNVPQAKAK